MTRSNYVSESVEVSRYLLPLLSEHQLYQVVSIFKKGFNLKPVKAFSKSLIYVSLMDKDHFSVINYAFHQQQLFKQLLANLQIGDRIVITAEKMVVYSLQCPLRIDIARMISISTDFSDQILNQADIDYLKKTLRSQDYIDRSGFKKSELAYLLDEWRAISFDLESMGRYRSLMARLIGRGSGLTPSGDDFLMGYLFALNVVGQDSRTFELILFQLLDSHSTTEVSLAYYEALRLHHTSPIWHRLIQAIKNRSIDEVKRTVQAILKIGHTSGHDLLVGFLTFFETI